MSSERTRRIFILLAVIGITTNLVFDFYSFQQHHIRSETQADVMDSYQRLREFDQALAHSKSQKHSQEIEHQRAVEEDRLLDRTQLDEIENDQSLRLSWLTSGLDFVLVLLLGGLFWIDLSRRRKTERVLQDTISHLNEANESLLKLEEKRASLIRTTVHDLKNPLGSIRGFADLIQEESEKESVVQMSEMIRRISENTLDLVNQLLQPRVLANGQSLMKYERFDLVELLDELLLILEVTAQKKNQELRLTSQEKEIWIWADRGKIRDLFFNLIGNALKFSPANLRVEIHVRLTAGDLIEVRVIDQGPGFTVEDQARAFLPGQKLSARPTGDETSTGMGLFSAKRNAELHGGKIEIDPNHGAPGACLKVILPLAPAQGLQTSSASSVSN